MGQTQRGFTMIEVLIVVVMLGILASVALPKILAPNERVRANEATQILSALMTAQRNYALENTTYAIAIANLDVTIPTSNSFNVPVLPNPALGPNANNSPPVEVASITRNNAAAYVLHITDAGVISCTPTAAACTGVCRGGTLNPCNN